MTSASNNRIPLWKARIRAERTSSSAACSQGFSTEVDHRRSIRSTRQGKLEEHVGALGAASDLREKPLEHGSCSLGIAREAVAARCSEPSFTRQQGIVRSQLGGELEQLGGGGERSASQCLLARGLQVRGDDSVLGRRRRAPGGGLVLDSTSAASASGPVHSALLPDRSLLVDRSRRAVGARTGSASHRARRRPLAPPPRVPEARASRSPCTAATSSTVGRASAATSSSTSSVPPGRRARRPPSSSCKLSGTRSAAPTVGLVFVRTSSRPSSSAKKGFPAVASCTRASSGRRQLQRPAAP